MTYENAEKYVMTKLTTDLQRALIPGQPLTTDHPTPAQAFAAAYTAAKQGMKVRLGRPAGGRWTTTIEARA